MKGRSGEGGAGGLPGSRSKSSPTRMDEGCTVPGSANSCLNTAYLRTVQQSTSYNLDKVVAPNSRRKVRTSLKIGTGSSVTEDMSPALAAGTYSRSAGTLHDQRQVSRNSLARSSRKGAGSGPGPGGRSFMVVGVPGLASACLGIPCSLVCHLGIISQRRNFVGWGAVSGTEIS